MAGQVIRINGTWIDDCEVMLNPPVIAGPNIPAVGKEQNSDPPLTSITLFTTNNNKIDGAAFKVFGL